MVVVVADEEVSVGLAVASVAVADAEEEIGDAAETLLAEIKAVLFVVGEDPEAGKVDAAFTEALSTLMLVMTVRFLT